MLLDETTYLVTLLNPAAVTNGSISPSTFTSGGSTLNNNWVGSAEAELGSSYATLVGTPNIIDIRNMTKNRAVRYDLSSGDLIIISENGQNIDYPTINWDIRNETYTMTIDIRTIHDERAGTDANFGRDRLERLYRVVRHRLEQNRKGSTITISSDSKKMNQLFLGSRTEANDRNKRLFGYKLTVEMKKFAVALP
tara:strand:+ start:14163 stop:14747 length:585 start_codon:yes stop_codon:yes gene_type:complete